MRLAQVIVVVVALVATPLALLARGVACDNSPFMCCMLHSQHSQICHCPMKSGHRALDFGFIAPIAPTHPMPIIKLVVPGEMRQAVAGYAQSLVSVFLSAPFEPPRS